MTQLKSTFDSQSLGTLESVLDEVHRELAGTQALSESGHPVISREDLAKLILHHAQDGESDPARLRTLVLKGIRREEA